MTGNQLERFSRAHRQVSQADDAAAHVRRRLAWRFEDDGSLTGTFRLPPLAGAVLLQALRAAAGDQDHPHDNHDGVLTETVPTETAPGDRPAAGGEHPTVTSSNLADALLVIAEAFLADKIAAADNPEVYQVTVHVGAGALDQGDPAGHTGSRSAGDVSAETTLPPRQQGTRPTRRGVTSRTGPRSASAPRDGRLHRHVVLDAPRSRRHRARRGTAAPPADPGVAPRGPGTGQVPVPVPGCESRRVDLHHIQYWSNGGGTRLENLISLCKYHHMLVHERGYLIAAARNGAFTFSGRTARIPAAPPCPTSPGRSKAATTPTSLPAPSSRPGTASASTWTTPSTPASPTPNTGPASATRLTSTARPDSAVGPDSRISQ